MLRLRAAAPWVLGAVTVAAFFAPLMAPGTALATRDVAAFHLPLRTDLARLADGGVPTWNPWIHGGQPLLSNPNYAAFYPPTWLAAVVAPAYALSLAVVLHAVLAFAGAWLFARRLGCGRGAAALAAVGFAAGGPLVGLVHAFNLLCGIAWLPWVGLGADAAFAAGPRRWLRPAAGCGAALAAQLLAGEPVAALVGALWVGGLALARRPVESRAPAPVAGGSGTGDVAPQPAGRAGPPPTAWAVMRHRALRLATVAALATLLAGVQLLPTWYRLADSPRAGALAAEGATVWSAPPGRLVELVMPRFWGDPAAAGRGLWFGWWLHDKQFPYLVSIYPGLLVTVLAVGALARRGLPRRVGWLAMLLGGVLLGVGRHDPMFGWLRDHLPLLGLVRYPEKLLLVALGALPFAAALGWQRLVEARRRGEAREADLPLAMAAAVALAGVGLAAATALAPAVAEGFVRAGSGVPPGGETLAAAVGFIRGEALAAALTAAACAAVLAGFRVRRAARLPSAVLLAAALVVLGADLWRCGHGLIRRVPAAAYREPPPLARAAAEAGGRLFTDQMFFPQGGPVPAADGGFDLAARRLDPYTGNLWGIGYALHEDYDLMLTGWGRHALEVLRADWGDTDRVLRILGGWNVGAVVMRRPAAELAAALAADGGASPVALFANPRRLPRLRLVPEVRLHPTLEAAVEAARAEGWRVDRRDHWLAAFAPSAGREPAAPPAPAPPATAPRILAGSDLGGRVEVRLSAADGGWLVAATTYDPGWRARLDGVAVPVHPTALGQLGVALPPGGGGERRLVLDYRDRRLGPGAALGLLGLAAAGAAVWRGRRPAPGVESAPPCSSKPSSASTPGCSG